jgi:hypothetical protein
LHGGRIRRVRLADHEDARGYEREAAEQHHPRPGLEPIEVEQVEMRDADHEDRDG